MNRVENSFQGVICQSNRCGMNVGRDKVTGCWFMFFLHLGLISVRCPKGCRLCAVRQSSFLDFPVYTFSGTRVEHINWAELFILRLKRRMKSRHLTFSWKMLFDFQNSLREDLKDYSYFLFIPNRIIFFGFSLFYSLSLDSSSSLLKFQGWKKVISP